MKTPSAQLEEYRARIDALDHELISILARRFAVVKDVGHLKVREKLSIIQPARAQAVIERAMKMAQEQGLNPDFARRLYETIIDHAHEIEHDILSGTQDA